ncbi:FAD/NAD(P)-binding protein [Novosphingobium terrae]|uniref:FAD/NAD(P)-binding protein n=1 Tax=Novosphingobium terrae TaxID=2726189 RepID=UPI00197D2A57|nr:FAD/NAD(P)-binding protein [Novosphingobium terrae]
MSLDASLPTTPTLPIAIVGAGFSGTLLAINLVRQGAPVVLVEREGAHFAKGVAYGTRQVGHLLNVRAANMSAFPEDPDHFLRWLDYDKGEKANRFVPRVTYGHYLHELLMAALTASPELLSIRQGEACDATLSATGVDVQMADGEVLAARALVLASGNFAPAMLPLLADLPGTILKADPWADDALEGLGDDAHVLLVGTGLTAADMAISLDRAGFGGKVTALSRRGLMPRAHAAEGPRPGPVPRPAERGAALLQRLRHRAKEVDWREAVDELRPHTQALWRLHDRQQQARLLRHLRPWWDVHRHRLAPPVAERIAQMQAEDRLTLQAGRILSAREEQGRARITLRPRGAAGEQSLTVDRILLCTGPESDIGRCGDPLLDRLAARGLIRSDRHRLGLDVDHAGRLIDAQGAVHEALLAVGPLTRGAFWESVAVPDIRRQVWSTARRMTQTHWVEGEGL